ncbi:apurinic/apyrimidinic endonuclease family protein [Mycolicibacterium helvum]|uniref:Xylose isomerase n=1 Tax=Mycolicibacterium helvum TaxID=1534349 RepID=A0A7I7TD35_9MYCO|nr:TIM barrel protein [Mycolicibacterium helvum]BBY66461.1 xylose isomerase [Mycolicibacterium helvum]
MTNTSAQGPRLHLGINTCFAVKRWPEPRDWARIAKEDLGLDVVQLSIDLLPVGFDPAPALAYAKRARQAAEEYDLEIHSLFTGLAAYSSGLLLSDDPGDRAAAYNWYEQMVAVTVAAGARGVGGHLGALSVGAAADAHRARTLIDDELAAMRKLADTAQAAGLDHLQFENLAVTREYGHSIDEAHAVEDALADTAIPWRLCLDLGHPAALDSETPSGHIDNWIRETWRHTPVVQLQQSPRGADHHGPFTAATQAAGTVDATVVVDQLRQSWTGDVYLFFEIIHAHEHPDDAVLADLRDSVATWRAALSSAQQPA